MAAGSDSGTEANRASKLCAAGDRAAQAGIRVGSTAATANPSTADGRYSVSKKASTSNVAISQKLSSILLEIKKFGAAGQLSIWYGGSLRNYLFLI